MVIIKAKPSKKCSLNGRGGKGFFFVGFTAYCYGVIVLLKKCNSVKNYPLHCHILMIIIITFIPSHTVGMKGHH